MIMAGTGEVNVLRRLRVAHGLFSEGVTYGSHLASHMALGLLFSAADDTHSATRTQRSPPFFSRCILPSQSRPSKIALIYKRIDTSGSSPSSRAIWKRATSTRTSRCSYRSACA